MQTSQLTYSLIFPKNVLHSELHSEHRAVALVLYLSLTVIQWRCRQKCKYITFHTSCCWSESVASDIIRRKPERRGRSASALKYSTSPAKLTEKGAGHSKINIIKSMIRRTFNFILFSAIEYKCFLSLKKLNDTRSKITKDGLFRYSCLFFLLSFFRWLNG